LCLHKQIIHGPGEERVGSWEYTGAAEQLFVDKLKTCRLILSIILFSQEDKYRKLFCFEYLNSIEKWK